MQLVKNCAQSILSELKLRKFGFQHNRVEEFYRSQWQRGERSLLYLIYRWIWAFFFIGVFAMCLLLQFSDGKFFIFMTNWGILLCLVTQLIAALLVTRWHFDIGDVRAAVYGMDRKIGSRSPGSLRFYWFLHSLTLALALVITTVYWTFLHGKMDKPMRFPVMSFITHCLNSVFMVVDFLIVAFPVRILHVAYPMLLAIFYFLFTVIYYFCGGVDEYGNHYVYPILDWTNPVRGLITFIGVFCLYLVFAFILFFIFKLKRFLRRSITTNNMWTAQVIGAV